MKRTRFYLPLAFTTALFGLYLIVSRTPMPIIGHGDIREVLFGKNLRVLLFAAAVALIFLIVRLIDTVTFDFILSRRKIVAPTILREIASISLYLGLIAWAISAILKYSVTGVLFTGTILAAVIGLALQDTLGNLFSGIALHMEETFDVGDVIRSGEFIGTIEGLNWRAARVRSFNDNLVILPNSFIARERLEIFKRGQLNARLVTVGVAYDHPPAKVIRILERAASNIPGIAREIPCLARVGGFGDSAINYEVKYWTREYQQRDLIDAEIRRAIWYAFRRHQMRVPYPIRSYQVHSEVPQREVLSLDNLRHRLDEIDVLAPLSDEERQAMADASRIRQYSRGETILRFGEAGNSMFVLHEGRASVRLPEGNRSREVAQLEPGMVFGEMALLTGSTRTADVIALTDVVLLEIGKESLQPVLLNNPEHASAISAKMLERRDELEMSKDQPVVESGRSLLERIREYFGL